MLFITNEVPCYTGGGTVIRDFNLLRHLGHSYRFTLLCFGDSHDEDAEKLAILANICEQVITVPRPTPISGHWQQRAALIGQIFHSMPAGVKWLTPDRMQKRVQMLCCEMAFDAIYVNHVEMGMLFPTTGDAKRIIGQEVVAPKVQRLLRTQRKPLGWISNFAEWLKMQRYENELYTRVDLCVVTSEVERSNVLARAPGTRVSVVPNGVDTTLLVPSSVRLENANPSLLFLGTLGYPPNQDAVLYFSREIWPLLHHRFPGLRWCIAGRSPSPEIQRLASSNVKVTGWIADVRQAMYSSAVMVVPLRSGSGTRLKILEAMAAGLPVVSTTIGAEGLEVSHEENIMLADTPTAFAGAIIRLLEDADLADRLRRNGRRLVEERYDWRMIAERLDAAFRQALTGRD